MTDEWQDVLERLCDFMSLEDNWDGEGTPAPSKEMVQTAVGFVDHMNTVSQSSRTDQCYSPKAAVFIGLNGTIHFEWPGQYTSVEVVSDGVAEKVDWSPDSEYALVTRYKTSDNYHFVVDSVEQVVQWPN